MRRTQFFNTVAATVEDGGVEAKELDFLDHNLTGFKITRQPLYYRVSQVDLQVPDNIAWKVYKDERLWWLLCLVNGINNPCEDMSVGDLLVVPNTLDIYDFFRKYRKR